VLADALTSLLAIIALVIGKFFAASWLDPVMGLVGAAVILRWAYSLCKATARELLDAYPSDLNLGAVRRRIEADGHTVVDLHAWRTGPSNLVCMLTVAVHQDRPQQDFRAYFGAMAQGIHLVVERV
jgi:Co/Zn/Cd efflux system component